MADAINASTGGTCKVVRTRLRTKPRISYLKYGQLDECGVGLDTMDVFIVRDKAQGKKVMKVADKVGCAHQTGDFTYIAGSNWVVVTRTGPTSAAVQNALGGTLRASKCR
jgi:hypothetical protein